MMYLICQKAVSQKRYPLQILRSLGGNAWRANPSSLAWTPLHVPLFPVSEEGSPTAKKTQDGDKNQYLKSLSLHFKHSMSEKHTYSTQTETLTLLWTIIRLWAWSKHEEMSVTDMWPFICICQATPVLQDQPIKKYAVTVRGWHVAERTCGAHSLQLTSPVTVYLFTHTNCNSVHGTLLQ